MNKKSVLMASRALRSLVLASTALVSLSACTQQKALLQTQSELSNADACIAKHQEQSQLFSQQQADILQQLQQVQQKLVAQQQAIEAKPQVIERVVTQAKCPPTPSTKGKKSQFKTQPMTDKLIVGLREQALIAGLDVVMQARISTGVANSVIDARNIQMFERNGDEWVRFTIFNPDTKEPHVLERKRLRFQTVQTTSPTPERRPVVEIRVTIGKLTQRGEFILADRSASEYPVLIGRNLLRDVMLVDVSENNLAPLQRVEEAASRSSAAVTKP